MERYWTLFKLNKKKDTNYWYRQYAFLSTLMNHTAGVHKYIERIDETASDVVIPVLVGDWYEEDFKKLRNAVVWSTHNIINDHTDHAVKLPVHIVISPYFLEEQHNLGDHGYGEGLTKKHEGWNGSVHKVTKEPSLNNGMSNMTFVINGEINESPCSECSNMIYRSAGKCSPMDYGCTVNHLFAETFTELPDKEEFVNTNVCTDYVAFKSRFIKNLFFPSQITDKKRVSGPDPKISRDAWTRRHFRNVACKHCMFFNDAVKKHNAASTCSMVYSDGVNDQFYGSCPGPFFETDFDKPDFDRFHEIVNYCGITKPIEWLKKLYKAGFVSGPACASMRLNYNVKVAHYDTENDRFILRLVHPTRDMHTREWYISKDRLHQEMALAPDRIKPVPDNILIRVFNAIPEELLNDVPRTMRTGWTTSRPKYYGAFIGYGNTEITIERNCGGWYRSTDYSAPKHLMRDYPAALSYIAAASTGIRTIKTSRGSLIRELLAERKVKKAEELVNRLSAAAASKQVSFDTFEAYTAH